MGAMAAANVVRWLEGRTLKPFKPAPKPVLIAFGDLQTYLVAGRTVLASRLLAGAKEGVYQLAMAQMAPQGLWNAVPAAAGRLWQGWRQLALPQLLSAGVPPPADCRCCRDPGPSTRPVRPAGDGPLGTGMRPHPLDHDQASPSMSAAVVLLPLHQSFSRMQFTDQTPGASIRTHEPNDPLRPDACRHLAWALLPARLAAGRRT